MQSDADSPEDQGAANVRSGTITRVSLQTRSGAERVNIFLDDAYAFSLAADIGYRLREGDMLDEPACAALLQEDDATRAYQHALFFIAPRPRSSAELRVKLNGQGHTTGAVEATLDKLRDQSLLDDKHFAEYWVQQRQTFRPRGARAVQAELRHKGIDREVAAEAIERSGIDQVAVAVRAGQRTAARLGATDERTFVRSLSAYLLRRGFDYATIKTAIATLWAEQAAEPAP